jgi:hypothetical protein
MSKKDKGLPRRLARIKEYLLVVEDLDAAILGSSPKAIGIYYIISLYKTTITLNNLVKDKKDKFE